MKRIRKAGIPLLLLVTIQALVGLTAIMGGAKLVSDPTGASAALPLVWLAGSPFPDYRIPGVVLLVVIGVGTIVAGVIVLRQRRYAKAAAFGSGLMLIAYITVEVWVVGLRTVLQPLYFALGLAMPALGAMVRRASDIPRFGMHGRRNKEPA